MQIRVIHEVISRMSQPSVTSFISVRRNFSVARDRPQRGIHQLPFDGRHNGSAGIHILFRRYCYKCTVLFEGGF